MPSPKKRAWYESCYVDFDQVANRATFVQHKWVLELIFLLMFSPLFYCLLFDQERFTGPMPLAWAAGAFAFFIGGGLVAHFRRCSFDFEKGRFRYYSGFVFTYTVLHGQTADIESIDLDRFESHEGGRRRRSQRLSFSYKGRQRAIADGGPGARIDVARRLAKALDCPLKRNGEPEA
jgi:hypothetical protein